MFVQVAKYFSDPFPMALMLYRRSRLVGDRKSGLRSTSDQGQQLSHRIRKIIHLPLKVGQCSESDPSVVGISERIRAFLLELDLCLETMLKLLHDAGKAARQKQ